jgi:hypothetical protein
MITPHLVFASYKKAYGIRGYEAKILITIKREEIYPGHVIAPLVSSQPQGILNRNLPSLTINKPKIEAESNPVIPT